MTQAAPDAPVEERANIADLVTKVEESGFPEDAVDAMLKDFQWQLVYQPWRSARDKAAFEAAQKSGRIPPPRDLRPYQTVEALRIELVGELKSKLTRAALGL